MLRAGGQSSDVVRAGLIEAQWHEMSQALQKLSLQKLSAVLWLGRLTALEQQGGVIRHHILKEQYHVLQSFALETKA